MPLPDPSPTGDGEADRIPNMAHIDAFHLTPSFSTTDVAVPMPGGELLLEFRRTLNVGSRIVQTGEDVPPGANFEWASDVAFGRAWSTNVFSRIIVNDNPKPRPGHAKQQATVYDEVGNAISYDLDVLINGNYRPEVRRNFSNMALRGTLSPSGNGFVYRKKHGTSLYFEAFVGNSVKRGDETSPHTPTETYYRLQKIVDRNGNELRYAYESESGTDATLVTAIYDPSRTTDPQNPVATTDRKIAFGYTSGKLTSVTDPLERVYGYEYTGDLLTRVTKPVVEGSTSQDPPTIEFGYQVNTMARSVLELPNLEFGGDDQQISWYLPTSIKDARGHTTTFTYGYTLTPTAIESQDGLPVLLYESKPHLTSATTVDGTAEFSFDGLSHIARTTKVKDTRGQFTIYEYGGTVVPAANDLGFALVINNVTRTTAGTNGAADAGEFAVTFGYGADISGNLQQVISGERQSNGSVVGNTVAFEYESGESGDDFDAKPYGDYFGTLYNIFEQPSRSVLSAGDLDIATGYRYDPVFNKLVKQIDAEGVETVDTLDANGNRTAVIEADGTSVQATTAYEYDGTGFVTKVTDPDGRVTEFVPNTFGHLEYTIVKGIGTEDLTPLDVNDGFYVAALGAAAERWLTTRRDADVMDRTLSSFDPTGDETTYTYDAWDRQLSVTLPPVEDPDNPPQTTTSTATTTYDLNSNVVKQVDHNGNTTVTFYDKMNRPTVSVLDLDGDDVFGGTPGDIVENGLAFTADSDDIVSRWVYDVVGLVSAALDPKGNRTDYEYDALLRKTKETLPTVTLPDSSTTRYETTYEYGSNSGSGAFTFGGFNPTRVVNARGFATDTSYDSAYRATQVVRRSDDGSTVASDAAARTGEPATLTQYNDVHNPVKVTVLNDDLASLGGTSANRTSFTFYDHRHRPTVAVVDMDNDGAGVAAGTFVDSAIGFSGDSDDLVSRTAYDEAGNVVQSRDAQGRVTDTTYDGASRVTRVELPTVSVHNPVTDTTTNARPTTTTVYDADGNVARVTDPNGNQSASFYDLRNRLTQTILDLDGDTLFETNGDDVVSSTGYDLSGNVLYTIDPRGNRTDTAYDRANRVTQIQGPEVPDAENGGTLTRPTTTTNYDKNSNVLTVTDPRGIVTATTYDELNRPRTVTANASGGVNDPDRVTTESQYDAHGNVISRILHNRVDSTDRPQETTYEYDAFDRQTKETLPGVGDSQPRITVTVYNRAGQALRVTDPKSQKHESTYDRAGRLVQSVHKRANDTTEETRTFEYDKVGNLLEATDLNGTSSYTYDALNRVTQESRDPVASGVATYDVLSAYDANGNRTKLTYPTVTGSTSGGRILLNRYDRRNLLTQVDDSVDDQTTTYAYDKSGNRTQQVLPNGVTTTSTFDALNRVETMVTEDGSSNTVYDVDYAYDLLGNRRTIDETTAQVGGSPVTRNLTYEYDDLYRLTAESWSGHSYSYTYDKAGNRLSKTVTTSGAVATGYEYDDLNQLREEVTGSIVTTYTYDLNGNTTLKSVDDGVDVTDTAYIFDTRNRLIEATVDEGSGASTVFEAAYDYRTRRMSKTENGNTTTFRYDGGTSFHELDDQGDITVEFIRGGSGAGMGGGIGSILYSDRTANGGPVEHYTYNAVGHTVAMTDDQGDVTKSNTYEAFGNIVATSGSSANNRLANTKERDASIGLDNHGFRYYDPSTGRYLTRDPIGYADGMNVYLSVHNNPINHIDALGLEGSPSYFSRENYAYAIMGRPTFLAPAGAPDTAPTQPTQANRTSRTAQMMQADPANKSSYMDAQRRSAEVAQDVEIIRATGETVYIETYEATKDEVLTFGAGKFVRGGRAVTTVVEETADAAWKLKRRATSAAENIAEVNQSGQKAANNALGEGVRRVDNVKAPEVPQQGIYEFPDATAGGTPYVGQSGNIPKRLGQHETAGRLTPGTDVTTSPVSGDKTAREIAEHKRIQELTGGVPARQSPDVANKIDPIGPDRQHLLDE